ncbi:MAG: hypothetical protein QM726_01360 [Chitinophagaceae bacterium]
MNKNFFSSHSPLFVFRWYILYALLIMGLMAWYDFTGSRVFNPDGQQQRSSSGPGYHK